MWLTIKIINVQTLQLRNVNWLNTYSTAKTFFFVTEDCSKNNAVLSSVISHARSLTKIINFYESSEEVSNVCKTLTENIGEACERRFYIYYNNLKPNDNKLKPITTALDP